ncbi:MAG: hypothetical protein WA904_05600 [Polaromonas sp.]
MQEHAEILLELVRVLHAHSLACAIVDADEEHSHRSFRYRIGESRGRAPQVGRPHPLKLALDQRIFLVSKSFQELFGRQHMPLVVIRREGSTSLAG